MSIRRWVRMVDEQHREAMRTIGDDLAERHFGRTDPAVAASRRRFMRQVGVGGAVAIGAIAVPTALLADAAGAQGSSSSSSEAPDLPPGDLAIVQFAEGLEFALEAAYAAAIDTKKLDNAQAEMARTFGRHHHEHGLALATLAGQDTTESTTNQPNQALVSALTPQISAAATATDLLQIFYSAEEGAAATYLAALGDLEAAAAAAPTATILPIESQHAVVIGQMLDLPESDWLPAFQTTTSAFNPATYGA